MGPTPDTVIIGAGQAGLTTSYWLTQLGVEHQILDRRDSLGGAFQDRWDSFYMNTPNLALEHLGSVDDGDFTFSDYIPARLTAVESIFAQRSGKAIDAYIAAAGIDAPEQPPAPSDDWLPPLNKLS